MALTLQIPLLNFNMGARHNYCHTVDTVMGMGVHDMQHTMASPRQSQTLGTDIHLPFRDQSDKCLQTNRGLAPPSPSLATDTKRLATDKQSVWQQTICFSVVVSTTEGLEIYSRPKAHSLQLEPDSRSLNLSRGMLTTLLSLIPLSIP